MSLDGLTYDSIPKQNVYNNDEMSRILLNCDFEMLKLIFNMNFTFDGVELETNLNRCWFGMKKKNYM